MIPRINRISKNGYVSGTRHGIVGGKRPMTSRRVEALESTMLSDIEVVSQGVPKLTEELIDRARRNVLGSTWLQSFPEGDQAEIGKELFDILGLRKVDQDPTRTNHRVTSAPMPSTTLGKLVDD